MLENHIERFSLKHLIHELLKKLAKYYIPSPSNFFKLLIIDYLRNVHMQSQLIEKKLCVFASLRLSFFFRLLIFSKPMHYQH